MREEAVGRRAVLAGGAAALTAGCVPCARLSPLPAGDTRLAIGDAHVHLFNAADLPVTGFFKNVVIPGDLGQVPEIGAAILDIATRVLKFFSVTAADELHAMRAPLDSPIEDVTAEAFAGRIKGFADAAIAERGFVRDSERDPRVDLGDSYYALAKILAAAQHGVPPGDTATDRARFDAVATIDLAFLASVARDGAAAAPADNLKSFAGGIDIGFVLSVIRWAFIMVQSRCSHVHRYLDDMASGTTRTMSLVNLLVDYDAWLGDAPKTGSDMGAQVRFWSHYARAAAPRVAIHTFAGYDPLAHAEALIDGRPGYWETRLGWALAGPQASQHVAGFKLYPPMGFNVAGNKPLPASGRACDIVRARWAAAGRDIARFADGLDRALDIFFADCIAHDLPLLAHGRNSEESYPGAGQNAALHYWVDRAARIAPAPGAATLRAVIAHYSGWEYGWWTGLPRLLALNAAKRSRLYVDIAYCTELLKGEASAVALLDDIGRICATQPDGDQWVVFGSDWIMLAQQPHYKEYVARLDAAIAKSGYWNTPERRQRLLGGNLETFLGRR